MRDPSTGQLRTDRAPLTTLYGGSKGTCLAGPTAVVVLDVEPTHPLVHALAPHLLAGAGIADVVDALGRHGIRQLPSFALVELVDGWAHSLVRGTAQIEVASETDRSVISATGLSSWQESRTSGTAATLRLEPSTVATLTIVAGVVPASVVTVGLGQPPSPPEPGGGADQAHPPPLAAPLAAVAVPPPVAVAAPVAVPPPAPAPPPSPPPQPTPSPPPAPEPTPAATAPPPPGPDPAAGAAAGPDDAPPRVDDPAATPADHGPPGLISAVPGMSTPPAPPRPVDATTPPPDHTVVPVDDEAAGDVDEPTVRGGGRLLAPGATGAMGASVRAVHCPAGHPNPPHGDRCRICDQPIVDATVATIPRPVLGRLRLPDGRVVLLDRPVILGRKLPREVIVEGEAAQLVAFPVDEKRLSRVHAEIRLADWQVQVLDRDSMNHTFVELPGQPPMQLRPAEAFPIPLGAIVNLGDAVRIELVGPER